MRQSGIGPWLMMMMSQPVPAVRSEPYAPGRSTRSASSCLFGLSTMESVLMGEWVEDAAVMSWLEEEEEEEEDERKTVDDGFAVKRTLGLTIVTIA